jgi:hypothetical protein
MENVEESTLDSPAFNILRAPSRHVNSTGDHTDTPRLDEVNCIHSIIQFNYDRNTMMVIQLNPIGTTRFSNLVHTYITQIFLRIHQNKFHGPLYTDPKSAI